MSYKILRTYKTRSDIKGIARYTLKVWSAEQMIKYLNQLDDTINSLKQNPNSAGQDRSSIKPGLRSLTHQNKHFIFFRVKNRNVEILRILHQRQDWPNIIGGT